MLLIGFRQMIECLDIKQHCKKILTCDLSNNLQLACLVGTQVKPVGMFGLYTSKTIGLGCVCSCPFAFTVLLVFCMHRTSVPTSWVCTSSSAKVQYQRHSKLHQWSYQMGYTCSVAKGSASQKITHTCSQHVTQLLVNAADRGCTPIMWRGGVGGWLLPCCSFPTVLHGASTIHVCVRVWKCQLVWVMMCVGAVHVLADLPDVCARIC